MKKLAAKGKTNIFGVPFKVTTLEGAYQIIDYFTRDNKKRFVVTANTEIVMIAQEDKEFMDIINKADLVVADGVGIVWASKYFGEKITERAAGFDLMNMILRNSPKKGYKIYLLGGKPGVAKEASAKIKEMYPGVEIVGCYHGYFSDADEEFIIEDINSKTPHFLFIGLGAPKQEKWIYKNLDKLDVKVCIGIGGSLDVFAGKTKRAPYIFQKLGLEWFYRLAREPSRISRMLLLPRFVLKVLFERHK